MVFERASGELQKEEAAAALHLSCLASSKFRRKSSNPRHFAEQLLLGHLARTSVPPKCGHVVTCLLLHLQYRISWHLAVPFLWLQAARGMCLSRSDTYRRCVVLYSHCFALCFWTADIVCVQSTLRAPLVCSRRLILRAPLQQHVLMSGVEALSVLRKNLAGVCRRRDGQLVAWFVPFWCTVHRMCSQLR